MSRSEKARREKERRERLRLSRQPQPLTPEEAACYPREIAHAIRLLEFLAARLEAGDTYDERFAADVRRLAHVLDGKAEDIARSMAFRGGERHRWRRLAQRFANRFAKS